MDSKIYLATLVLLTSCSSDSDVGLIGQRLSQQAGLYNSYGIETKNIFVVDSMTNRILGVNSERMTLDYEFTLSNPGEEHSLAVDANERFVVDFSKKHLQVIGFDGRRHDNPIKFLGTPVSVAYGPTSRTLVMQDDLKSIGILKLGEAGDIQKSWLGGPLIASGKNVAAGDLDKAGRMILSMSDNSVTTVDLDATLAQQSWQTSSFTTTLTGINWVAPDQSLDDMVLVASDTKLGLINMSTQTLLDSVDFPASAIGKQSTMTLKAFKSQSDDFYRTPYYYNQQKLIGLSKAGKPHAIVRASSATEPVLLYAGSDGKIKSHPLQKAASGYYLQSYLSTDSKELVVMLQLNNREISVLGLRLSDNLVIRQTTVPRVGSAQINNKLLFIDHETDLGRLDLHNLADDTVKTIDGYNFDFLRHQ
jgi:hypothetical protein